MLILAVGKVPRELDVIKSVENVHLAIEMATCLIVSEEAREHIVWVDFNAGVGNLWCAGQYWYAAA